MTRFLFYVPDANTPTGGVNVIFDIVETLKFMGIQAEAISSNPTFQYDFLSRKPQICYLPQIREPRPLRARVRTWPDRVRAKKRNAEVVLKSADVIGVGGAEFLESDVGYPIEDGNLMEYVTTVELVADRCRKSDAKIEDMRRRATDRITEKYSHEKHVNEVRRVFGELARKPSGS